MIPQDPRTFESKSLLWTSLFDASGDRVLRKRDTEQTKNIAQVNRKKGRRVRPQIALMLESSTGNIAVEKNQDSSFPQSEKNLLCNREREICETSHTKANMKSSNLQQRESCELHHSTNSFLSPVSNKILHQIGGFAAILLKHRLLAQPIYFLAQCLRVFSIQINQEILEQLNLDFSTYVQIRGNSPPLLQPTAVFRVYATIIEHCVPYFAVLQRRVLEKLASKPPSFVFITAKFDFFLII